MSFAICLQNFLGDAESGVWGTGLWRGQVSLGWEHPPQSQIMWCWEGDEPLKVKLHNDEHQKTQTAPSWEADDPPD